MQNLNDIREFRYQDIPENLNSNRCKQKIKEIVENEQLTNLPNYYNHRNVKDKLKKYHGRKCVYCEDNPLSTGFIRIDHYRPKSKIKNIDENKHKGYYWLRFEWTNLMQSCEMCNHSKSNHFPLKEENSRVNENSPRALTMNGFHPLKSPLIYERRLLINPEIDNVNNNLTIDIGGKIISETEEGKTSIEIYNLNRKPLRRKRIEVINSAMKELKRSLRQYNRIKKKNIEIAKDELQESLFEIFHDWLLQYRKKVVFSMVYYNLFDRIEYFLNNNEFLRYEIPLILKIYNDYKKKGD